MFNFNNRITRARCEICSKLTTKISECHQWRCSGVFIVSFEQISYLVPTSSSAHLFAIRGRRNFKNCSENEGDLVLVFLLFKIYYKSGQNYNKSGLRLLLQIGAAHFIANHVYYKSGQFLQTSAKHK